MAAVFDPTSITETSSNPQEIFSIRGATSIVEFMVVLTDACLQIGIAGFDLGTIQGAQHNDYNTLKKNAIFCRILMDLLTYYSKNGMLCKFILVEKPFIFELHFVTIAHKPRNYRGTKKSHKIPYKGSGQLLDVSYD
jgi:hypothetical protein